MDELAIQLDTSIKALEELRDAMDDPRPANQPLKKLYAHKLALAKATIDRSSGEYQTAARAMADAASRCREAVADLRSLEEAISEVDTALRLVGALLEIA